MTYEFYKYQGTGNDFVIIDNRQLIFNKNNTELISRFCDRRFGIGADGLILLENHETSDFKMVYFNSDGNESSMCGNGTFEAIDGVHKAVLQDDQVSLLMQDVLNVENHGSHIFLDTGSPHHVQMCPDMNHLQVKELGAKIRYGEPYGKLGANVNFVNRASDIMFRVRTYERGVENETLSCGTGVTAVALAMHYVGETEKNNVELETQGGRLKESFKKKDKG